MRAGQALSHSVMGFYDRSGLHPEDVKVLAERIHSADDCRAEHGPDHDLAEGGTDVGRGLVLQGVNSDPADQLEHLSSPCVGSAS